MTQKHINKVMSNNGNGSSYSEYREKRFGKKELWSRYKGYLKAYINECKGIVKRTLKGESTLRFILATTCYYKARVIYDYQIVNNERFRKMVMKNNWLKK